MAIVNQDIPDELLGKFYNAARLKFGDRKGCKRSALIEAIQGWLKEQDALEQQAVVDFLPKRKTK